MSERKSPPGPREMVQEHSIFNTYALPSFTAEGVYQECDLCQGEGCVWCDDSGLVLHDCSEG